MNGFKKHGINHLSASSINMYANAPCAWVARYLFDRKFSFANAARAGVLVEEAVVKVIADGYDIDKAIDDSQKEYNKSIAIGGSDADRKRGDGMEGMIRLAVEELKPYGKPEFDGGIVGGQKQKKIEIMCNGDGWKLPIIGYLDFYFPEHGLVVDLKTSMKAPSQMSDEHIRQGVLYRAAMGNCAVKFLYVTPKKAVWHEIDDTAATLSEIKAIANRMERILRMDAEDIKEFIPVNTGSYYWSDDSNIRQELYGI